jgi:putative Mg2+ transporter-C (MgtC) family protein
VIDPATVLIRVALAIALGAIIGVEREWRQKHAGLKTMTLVSLGAAGFAMMSNTFGPNNHNPAQIAAAVVGGIGFIGAGVIMHRGLTVQGVTTAATLWADASVGVAVGLGHQALAIGLTGGIVLVQVFIRQAETLMLRFARRDNGHGRFELRVDCDAEAVPMVNREWKSVTELKALRRSISRGPELSTLRVVVRADKAIDLSGLEERLVAMEGVRRVDIRHLGVDED